MTVGNATAGIPSLPSSRRTSGGKKIDRWLIISLCVSILLHSVAWLVYRHYAARPVQHVFILLNAGDQAMEMTLGGATDRSPSQASPKEEIQEKRFDPELPSQAQPEKAPHTLTPEPKHKLSLPLTLPDRARLSPDKDGIFIKPHAQKKKANRTTSPSLSPALPSTASTSGSGASPASPGVRQRATPSGPGFTLIYPESARQSGETGTVEIEALISPDGVCRSAVVTRPSPYSSLNEAALAAILAASYHPARQNGHPVASQEVFEIAFELAD